MEAVNQGGSDYAKKELDAGSVSSKVAIPEVQKSRVKKSSGGFIRGKRKSMAHCDKYSSVSIGPLSRVGAL